LESFYKTLDPKIGVKSGAIRVRIIKNQINSEGSRSWTKQQSKTRDLSPQQLSRTRGMPWTMHGFVSSSRAFFCL